MMAIISGLAISGCSRANQCTPGKTCLRYMAWGNPEQLQVERKFIADFNRKNPEIEVRLFNVPGSSYGQKMTTMLVSGTAPDILRVDQYNFLTMQKKGYFMELDPLISKDPEFNSSDFYPQAIEEGTVGGKLYGLNVLFGGIVMYYNKTLFKEAGLPDPYELHRRNEWTIEKYREFAIKLTQQKPDQSKTFGTTVPTFPLTVPIIMNFGGELIDINLNTSKVDSKGTVAAYQFLSDLVWKDKAAPTAAQSANSAYTFESGKVGMIYDFMGMTPRFREMIKDFEWDIVPIPRGPGSPVSGYTVVKGNQLVIAKSCKQPEAAWKFVRYMTSPETENVLYVDIRRSFPTRRAVAESPEFLNSTLPPFQTRGMIESIERGKRLPLTERWGEWTQMFTAEIDNVMSGREKNVESAFRRAKQKIDTALAEKPGF